MALIVCFVLYLFWWWVFFCPRAEKPAGVLRGAGIAGIVCAGICGIAGIWLCVSTLVAVPSQGYAVQPWQVAVGGVIAYVVLLAITVGIFKRQVTSELVIITAWVTLELAVLDELFGMGVLGAGPVLALAVLLGVLFIVSLVCYLRFFHLEGKAAFVCGSIPLVSGIVYSAIALVVFP